MILTIEYAGKELEVEIPDQNLIQVVDPNEVEKRDEREVVLKSLESFSDFISGGKVLFVVNDTNRPTPTSKVLSFIEDQLDRIEPEFMVATGSHKALTEEEMKWIFGDLLEKFRDRIHIHSGRESPTELLGTTSRGTEVRINKKVLEFDKLVNINSVEPHYFAGYTGGRKSFIPGVSAYKTIEQNHRNALSPEAKTCKLDGNPVHEDMLEAVAFLEKRKKIYSINLVLDGDNRIYDAKAGNLHSSFLQAVKSSKKISSVKIKEKADIVISVAREPFDINLYQAQKAIENGKLALKENGTLILVAECREGIGPSKFYDLLSRSDIPEELYKEIKREYVLGYHKAAKILELVSCSKLCAVSSLDDKIVENCFMAPFPSLQEALDRNLKDDSRIIVLRNGTATVPILE